MTDDPYGLARFVRAQDADGTYERALDELRRGRKTSHWMWFVFPQIAGLGVSAMSQRYALSSLAEAQAYLAHPVLGARLRECTSVLAETSSDVTAVLGGIDAHKLHSSATLFHRADPDEPVFGAMLHSPLRRRSGRGYRRQVARLRLRPGYVAIVHPNCVAVDEILERGRRRRAGSRSWTRQHRPPPPRLRSSASRSARSRTRWSSRLPRTSRCSC